VSTFDKYDAPMLFGKVGERQFHALAKPTGSTCNLDCVYCYYLRKEQLLKAAFRTPYPKPIGSSQV
jgi:sulfatase maturation enzyme AslB (radical SAM superfamily)